MAEKTRRQILEEAFDAEEAKETGAEDSAAGDSGASQEGSADTSGADSQEQTQDAGAGEEGDAKGVEGGKKPQKDPKEKTAESAERKPETADQKEAKAAQADAQRGQEQRRSASVSDRAPNSWKPGPREDWSKIPARARAEIGRREMEIQRELSQTATIRKFSQDLASIVQPHLPSLQAQNIAPLVHIDALMKASSALYSGNAEQKARQIAQIIQTYGVDVRVLDKVLSGQALPPPKEGAQGGGNSNAIPDWAKPIFNFMTQQEAQRQQYQINLQSDAAAEVEEAVGKLEFLQDLRQDVADILEIAARRGRVMSLEDAYKRAVAADPEISQIVAQKEAAARQRSQGSSLSRQQRAASTIRGSTPRAGAGAGSGGKQTRRQLLEAAWDDAAS